jgi:hypothetical protein
MNLAIHFSPLWLNIYWQRWRRQAHRQNCRGVSRAIRRKSAESDKKHWILPILMTRLPSSPITKHAQKSPICGFLLNLERKIRYLLMFRQNQKWGNIPEYLGRVLPS